MRWNWETTYKERVLSVLLIPPLMELWFGGNRGVRIVLEWLGLPSEAWIVVVYEVWTNGATFPMYLFNFGLIVSSVGIAAGLAKLFVPDQLIETTGLRGGLSSLSQGDLLIIVSWILLAAPIAVIVDYPLEPIPLLQLAPFIALQIAYIRVPAILSDFFGMPYSISGVKDVLTTSSLVVTSAFLLSVIFTHLFLLPIRVLDFYGIPL